MFTVKLCEVIDDRRREWSRGGGRAHGRQVAEAVMAASESSGTGTTSTGHSQGVLAAAEDDAVQGTDVAEVAAPGDRDMARCGQEIVRGIDVDPADAVAIKRNPGVGRVRSGESRLAGGGSVSR